MWHATERRGCASTSTPNTWMGEHRAQLIYRHNMYKPNQAEFNSVRRGNRGHPWGRKRGPQRWGAFWAWATLHGYVGFVKTHLYYVAFCVCILCFNKKKEEKKGRERLGRGEKTHSKNLARPGVWLRLTAEEDFPGRGRWNF